MNNQQRFLSELVELCKKHNVEVNGQFTVWPIEDKESFAPILADIHSANPKGILVGPRSKSGPWVDGMMQAYERGIEDAKIGTARPQRAEGFDACYWQGWSHGQRKA
jgi:hypothetical protein